MNTALLKRQIFRPALNGLEVIEIAALFKKHAPMSDVCKKFATQEFKLTQGISDPSYIKQESIEEQLGITTDKSIDKATMKTLCYDKWISDSSSCTIAELAMAMEYKFDNRLMTPAEEDEYVERNK